MGEKDILIVNRMGYDLSMLFEHCNHSFSLGTTLKIGIEMIKLIKKIHSKGIIHRDIKPNNFMTGYKDNNDKINIIDFGLAKSYLSTNDKSHKLRVIGLQPIGTARYASIYTHNGISQSRRDDLESIGYVLIYFLQSKLPWQGLKLKNRKDKWQKILNSKINTDLNTLCKGIPNQFKEYLESVRNLKFEQKPEYKKYIELFNDAAKQNEIDLDTVVWDWEQKDQN